jgi:alpha-glucosidase (family GH31 glycosyl hydrolase)
MAKCRCRRKKGPSLSISISTLPLFVGETFFYAASFRLHFDASLNGHTVIRPLFFEFPLDGNTHNISYQFMWGPAMLITPVLYPVRETTLRRKIFPHFQGVSTVRGYVPPGAWYSLYDFNYGRLQPPGYQDFSAPSTSLIPVHVRGTKIVSNSVDEQCAGGFILPRQGANVTTTLSRRNPFELLVALGELNPADTTDA